MVAKKPPFEAPLMITKRTRGPKDFENGHIRNKLIMVENSTMHSVLKAPKLSAARPVKRRPTADEILKPERRAAPRPGENPREALKSGIKKGGTIRGNVAIMPTRNIILNFISWKNCL